MTRAVAALAASPAAAILEFPLPVAHLPNQITPGPDGALWFTEADRIGRVTTGGVVSELVIGMVNNPQGIVTGPDGALWLTESAAIGRLTLAGALTHFPTAGAPQQIVVGPDGALWFTESSNKIGRLTTAGGLTEFPVVRKNSMQEGSAAVPGGRLMIKKNTPCSPARVSYAPTSAVCLVFEPSKKPSAAKGDFRPSSDAASSFGNRSLRNSFALHQLARIFATETPRTSLSNG